MFDLKHFFLIQCSVEFNSEEKSTIDNNKNVHINQKLPYLSKNCFLDKFLTCFKNISQSIISLFRASPEINIDREIVDIKGYTSRY